MSIWLRTVIDTGTESVDGVVTERYVNTENLVSLDRAQRDNVSFKIVARDVSGQVHVLGEYARREDREKDWLDLGEIIGGYTESLGGDDSPPTVH